VARQLVKYRLDLVGQRLDGTREAPNEQRIIHLSMENEMKIINLELLAHQRILSVVDSIQLVSNMTSHTVLRGHWCDNIVLKTHPSTKDKSDNSKHSSYEELEQVFKHLTKYNMKILLGNFNVKLGRKDIRGWSEKFSASTIDGYNGKIFFS
jgi:hypothetical protein